MAIDVVHVGDLYRIEADFTDIDGDAVDPTTVSLVVIDPSGNEDTYTLADAEVTKVEVGSYYKDVDIDEAGDWFFRWETTGIGQAAEEGQLVAQPTPFS